MSLTSRRNSLLTALLLASLCFPLLSGQAQDQAVVPRSRGWLDPTINEEYKKWLREDVVWIITDQERADFKKLLGDKQRDEFVVAFWERRNPTPGFPANSFKEEHYRRLAFANTHFAAGIPGWKTDRGRIYIVYGSPDEIGRHPGSPEQYPSEVWRYKIMKGIGSDVSVEFVDTCRCGDYQLTVDWSKEASPAHKD
jgi:GWxTD domain-containing protein